MVGYLELIGVNTILKVELIELIYFKCADHPQYSQVKLNS